MAIIIQPRWGCDLVKMTDNCEAVEQQFSIKPSRIKGETINDQLGCFLHIKDRT